MLFQSHLLCLLSYGIIDDYWLCEVDCYQVVSHLGQFSFSNYRPPILSSNHYAFMCTGSIERYLIAQPQQVFFRHYESIIH